MIQRLVALAIAVAAFVLGLLYGTGITLQILRSVRDSLPRLKPTDGNVAAHVLSEWIDDRTEGDGSRPSPGYSINDVDAVRRVIDAGTSARPALGQAITRLEGRPWLP